MALTIDEIKEKKIDREAKVTKLFKEFEKEAGVKVSYIDIMRKRIKTKPKANDVESAIDVPYRRRGELKTVLVNVDFEDF